MEATLLLLAMGHLIGDFVLQTSDMVRKKRRWYVFSLHMVLVTAATAASIGTTAWVPLAWVVLSHAAIDAGKIYLAEQRLTTMAAFTIDQLLHVTILVYIASIFPDLAANGWLSIMQPEAHPYYLKAASLVCGLIMVVCVGGHIVASATSNLLTQEDDSNGKAEVAAFGGLPNGGRYIGWLERALVMLLMLIGQPNGVGFLIAAKSILRFGDIKEDGQRKIVEYVIIGTFMSFGWAILMTSVTVTLVAHWQ